MALLYLCAVRTSSPPGQAIRHELPISGGLQVQASPSQGGRPGFMPRWLPWVPGELRPPEWCTDRVR
jgi:hypothetical protein